eukprot:Skav200469  [mRNA]  locus=scaffold5182:38929:39501:- [translate_table: standard]
MQTSPVFEKMLTQDMVEKESQRISLPGKCPKEFQVLLQFLQPRTGRQQKVTDENVDFLVRWCDEYGIDSLKIECVEFIKRQPPSMHRLVQAHGLGLNDVAQKMIDHLIEKGETDWKTVYAHPELMQKVMERTFKLMLPQKVLTAALDRVERLVGQLQQVAGRVEEQFFALQQVPGAVAGMLEQITGWPST